MKRVDCGLLVSIFGFPLVVLVASGFDAEAIALALIALVISGLATILVAAPLFVWCRRRGWLSLWPFAYGGVFAGFVFSLPITVFAPPYIVVFTGVGLVLGTLFWLVAVFRNPNLHEWRAFSSSKREDLT